MKKLLLLPLVFVLSVTFAQKKKTEAQPAPTPQATGIAAKVAGMKHYPGYFDFYYDEKQDKILLVIDKFDTEFLYVNSLPAGIGSNDIGLDRGQLGNDRIVKFERRGPKILMTQPNYQFRAITSNVDERNAVEQAFAQSVLWGFTVTAEEKDKVLVDATDFYFQDAHDVIGRLRGQQQGNYSLDKSRSAFYLPRTKNFPQNTEVEVTLTFTGQATGGYIRSVTPTPNVVTVRQHHSFVQLPDDKYKPRKFDPRAGYFGTSFYDYATPIHEPIEKRFINRHRLEKKNPNAAMSEPVEPIIYYLDRGTPEPIRSALLDGARWWNQAFEAAGFINAFRVEMMPEDADPMDVRYNLIQWVHRSTRGWSYGASVSDPRTGEIIKGHVSLGSLRVRQDFLIAEGLLAPYEEGKTIPPHMLEMALARLRQLSAHEVGHTIGLAHSYASSTENLASVMDYPHPIATIKDGKIDLSQSYDDKIGAWDKVAVTYGYAHFPEGTNEDVALEKILQDGSKQGLTFLSDQDARPTGGAHPFAHLWDNGQDAADELNRVMQVRTLALKNFGEKNIREGTPMALLEEALVPIYFFHRYQAEATSKIIGGLNYRYALRGDGQPVTELIAATHQQKAMDALLSTVSPQALSLPADLIKNIPPHPIGYQRTREVMRTRTDLTFDPLAYAESASDMVFGLIFHPARATRLVQHNALNNQQPSLESVIDKIVNSSFKSANKSGYEGLLQMTVNHSVLNNLIKLNRNQNASAQARAIASLKIDQLKTWLTEKTKTTTQESWKAHYAYALSLIQAFRENPEKYEAENLLTPPPGQPIGTDDVFCTWDSHH
ncbi:MAG: zinc-dependent metalloprotease [Cyclobacteriaceae bacterium]|nr:MAG: zinc-dependent metalloprotease [Cyclobacteriaceae bacterium]